MRRPTRDAQPDRSRRTSALLVLAGALAALGACDSTPTTGASLTGPGPMALSQLESLGASAADRVLTSPRFVAYRERFVAQHGKDEPIVALRLPMDVVGGWRDDRLNAQEAYDAFAEQLMNNGIRFVTDPAPEPTAKDGTGAASDGGRAKAVLGIAASYHRTQLDGETEFEFRAKLVDALTKTTIVSEHETIRVPSPKPAP